MNTTPAPWTFEIARRPIAFAQVREDPVLDQWIVDQLGKGVEVLLVASGGCTACLLGTLPRISRLHLIDPNPAQIALARLKLRLLARCDPAERLSILGHAAMPEEQRRLTLARELAALDLPPTALGPVDLLGKIGPDTAGRYEGLFSKLREALSEVAGDIATLLRLGDPVEQSQRAHPSTRIGTALDAAFDSVMALPNLIGLFGEGATRNRCEPFSRHFAGRTRHVLATLPAGDNPYLWQLLRGEFPNGVTYPWLGAAKPTRLPEVQWTVASMADALRGRREEFDFIHLSNILDWLPPEEARSTLESAWSALRRGGLTFIRQLNSSLDVPSLGTRFEWQEGPTRELHLQDRSFFYRNLHLGLKR
jgi:S-adenosylmethionine-diacylglycerol 3-amino-3-carboxypropyl transferase